MAQPNNGEIPGADGGVNRAPAKPVEQQAAGERVISKEELQKNERIKMLHQVVAIRYIGRVDNKEIPEDDEKIYRILPVLRKTLEISNAEGKVDLKAYWRDRATEIIHSPEKAEILKALNQEDTMTSDDLAMFLQENKNAQVIMIDLDLKAYWRDRATEIINSPKKEEILAPLGDQVVDASAEELASILREKAQEITELDTSMFNIVALEYKMENRPELNPNPTEKRGSETSRWINAEIQDDKVFYMLLERSFAKAKELEFLGKSSPSDIITLLSEVEDEEKRLFENEKPEKVSYLRKGRELVLGQRPVEYWNALKKAKRVILLRKIKEKYVGLNKADYLARGKQLELDNASEEEMEVYEAAGAYIMENKVVDLEEQEQREEKQRIDAKIDEDINKTTTDYLSSVTKFSKTKEEDYPAQDRHAAENYFIYLQDVDNGLLKDADNVGFRFNIPTEDTIKKQGQLAEFKRKKKGVIFWVKLIMSILGFSSLDELNKMLKAE